MPRYKDLPKIVSATTDLTSTLEQEVKGSISHIIKAEPAVMERPPEIVISQELDNLKAGLLEVKEDLKHIRELIEKIQANGLRMKPQF